LGELRKALKILALKSEERRPVWTDRHRWEGVRK
jgi:hypothetical protein